ncbi:hypothetical protein [Ureibacillus aquaedulcis]|uniref:Uncharacterized protein n=1 Tax=Ureibacillus aquaedulcis TaxID=3058421 RepID=A0ABT8GVA4_9BACL|nr:hypothetical protein [Ureibacillus sp. BA0131]MDN4495134.1 hypothetical protein [Ureibacillus sp. BA0131]
MKMEEMLRDIDLAKQLENLIKNNSDLQLRWVSGYTDINGRTEYREYLTMEQQHANHQWVEHFLKEFNPVYEQLTLYTEYYYLRTESLIKDSYNLEELQSIEMDYITIAKELLMSRKARVKRLESLDALELDRRDISKHKLLYLAANTPSTLELYETIENKMRKNPDLFPTQTTKTTQQLTKCFTQIQDAIDTLLANPNDEMISYTLATLLIHFYPALKVVIEAMQGRNMYLN